MVIFWGESSIKVLYAISVWYMKQYHLSILIYYLQFLCRYVRLVITRLQTSPEEIKQHPR